LGSVFAHATRRCYDKAAPQTLIDHVSTTPPDATNTRYAGPLALAQAMSTFALLEANDTAFTRDGPRADVEYRDLGWSAATNGRIGAKHVRAIRPFDVETGWHWHDMTAHFVIVLKGWIKFRYAGIDGEVTVRVGATLSQPGGVPHNVVGRSDDLELIEINMPAEFATVDLPGTMEAAR
jgi:mannose-6-phosphate isomerase-like protein (cupin superfamily)